MKLVVLAAGKSSTLAGLNESPPVCLSRFDQTEVVLDTLVAMGQRAGTTRSIVVGGYRLTDIMQARPNLSYYYNSDWKETGALASLLQCAHEFDDDMLIAYSDVVHNRDTATKMMESEGDVVVAYDSLWKTRYEGRTARQRGRAEVFIKTGLGSQRIRRASDFYVGNGTASILGEYAGLILLRKDVVRALAATLRPLIVNDKTAGIDVLLAALDTHRTIAVHDLKGGWAELDSEADLASFRFGTKAETLTSLENMLLHGRVLPQFTFTVRDWQERQDHILQSIGERFSDSNRVVARSSAINEDTEESSMAGNFESVLQISLCDGHALTSAIEQVCHSYRKNGESDLRENQILIQPMLQSVKASGVVFTSDLETAAPYYTIAIDRTGSTDSVTSGVDGEIETLVVARDANLTWKDPYIRELIVAIKEIEKLTGYSSLDIEFAIEETADGSPEVIVLQVRPIAAHKEQKKVSSRAINAELLAISQYVRNDNMAKEPLCGNSICYGVMPDWNPAEIIGVNPRPLAFSLYRHVITDEIWGRSREACGYRMTYPRPGLVNFSGKPYVDVRMSFSSFVPADLDQGIANKLVQYAVDKLRGNPELHDKVEFMVMPTVFDFDFDTKIAEWREAGFTEDECQHIRDAYVRLTVSLVDLRRVKADLDCYLGLEEGRNQLMGHRTRDQESRIETIQKLLADCQSHGTLPFSNLARYAFVGVTLLKTLVKRGVFSSERYAEFLASIHTVAKQFMDDLAEKPKSDLIADYGHLRPGTYDVTSLAYENAFDHYIDLENRPHSERLVPFILNVEEESAMQTALVEEGLDVAPEQLLDFIRAGIQGRESGKFEFSKNLSLAIEIITEFGEAIGLDREEVSFLEIEDFLALSSRSIPANLADLWRDLIKLRRRQYAVTCAIKLPELIGSERDIWCFKQGTTKPNFITQKAIVATIADLVNASPTSLDGMICLIENADPGFDWIFSHRIAGLITAYGGANSHMAIRCAEFEIPAAIGCGDALYRTYLNANRIRLDCASETIEALS